MTLRTILIVEDNADDAQLTVRAFRKAAMEGPIHVAADGQEALDWLFARVATDALPAVVLLDLRMPRVDGFEVLRRLRADARTAHVPTVILTSSREQRDLVRGYELGANSYLRKPVDFGQFLELARDIGRYWALWNELPAAATRP
jgi:two-component system response regulator